VTPSKAVATRRVAAKVPREVHASEHGLFYALLKREGIPLPVTELRFHPDRRWRFDFAWIGQLPVTLNISYNGGPAMTRHTPGTPNVALEVEGGAWSRGRHTRGKGFIADMVKYNEAAVRGWKVLRVTPSQLCTLETIALIKRALSLTDPEPVQL
jgi:hypothetical protein